MKHLAHALETQIRSLVCESLRVCASGDEAVKWLRTRNVRAYLIELAEENENNLRQLEATSTVTYAVLNRPELLHYAAIFDAPENTEHQLLRSVGSSLAREHFPQSGIWRAYATALVNYHAGIHGPLSLPKARGYEKFYLPYIEYMLADSDSGRDKAIESAAKSFEARNRDKRYTDWVGLDGDGKKPVRWDFRLYALQ